MNNERVTVIVLYSLAAIVIISLIGTIGLAFDSREAPEEMKAIGFLAAGALIGVIAPSGQRGPVEVTIEGYTPKALSERVEASARADEYRPTDDEYRPRHSADDTVEVTTTRKTTRPRGDGGRFVSSKQA